MRLFGDLLPFEDALRTILEHITPIDQTEKVALDDAAGRVVAEDISALHDIPPFDRSGVDGFAVVASDTEGASNEKPVPLELVDTVYAGSASGAVVIPSRCVKIATGARVPPGADAVVMAEDTRTEGRRVSVMKQLKPGENLGRIGDDIKKGEPLVKAGALLHPSRIGVLASQGISSVTVYSRPKVAILPTGEEIVEPGRELSGSQIYDINSHTLSAMVSSNGGEPVLLPITGDNLEKLKERLEHALRGDMVLTSGGSSVGDKDLLMDILEARGRVFFHGVRIKPGKPTTFSEMGGRPVLGMPGNPTTCLMAAYLFMAPALRKLARLPQQPSRVVKAALAKKVTGAYGRTQFLTVRIEGGLAYPVFKESSAITSMSRAEGYVVVPENTEINEGSPVEVVLF
jgi:molybdopterin molybdotransferase